MGIQPKNCCTKAGYIKGRLAEKFTLVMATIVPRYWLFVGMVQVCLPSEMSNFVQKAQLKNQLKPMCSKCLCPKRKKVYGIWLSRIESADSNPFMLCHICAGGGGWMGLACLVMA